MSNITDYIKLKRSEGESDSVIRQDLLKSKWKKLEIDDAFRSLDEHPEFTSLLPVSVLVRKAFHSYRKSILKIWALTLVPVAFIFTWSYYGRLCILYLNQALNNSRAITMFCVVVVGLLFSIYILSLFFTAILKVFSLPNLGILTSLKLSLKQAVGVSFVLAIFILLSYVGWWMILLPGILIFFTYLGSVFMAMQGYAYEIKALTLSRRLLKGNVLTMIWHLLSVGVVVVMMVYVLSFLVYLASLLLFKAWPAILNYEDNLATILINLLVLPFILSYLQLLYSNLYYEKILPRQRSKIEWILVSVFIIIFFWSFISFHILRLKGVAV